MIFDDSLRQFLTDKIEFFRENPDRLIISVEKGSLKWAGQSLSHRQHYQLLVEVDEFPESLDANLVIVAVLDWYQRNQDPVPANASPIEFESYILSNYTTTVVFTIKVEEVVRVSTDDAGRYIFNTCPPPSINTINITSPSLP